MKLQAVTSSNESLKYEECFSNQRIEKKKKTYSLQVLRFNNVSLFLSIMINL